MSYVKWKIEHTPFDEGYDDADTTEITDFHDVIVRVSLGDGRDSFQFKVVNFNNTLNDKFNANDKIVLYRILNSESTTSSDILMVGACRNIPETESGSQNTIRVEGYNYSESVMEAIAFVDLDNFTIDQGIKEAIENAAQKNPYFKVTWSTGNPTTKSDEITAFPTIASDTRFFNKPLKSIIEKYSTIDKTADVDYYWYVNNDNEFIWRPKLDKVDHTFNVDTEPLIKSIKIGKDASGIRNYIIIKGGFDPEGNTIQTRYVNWTSVNANGMKYHFMVDDKNYAKNLVGLDQVKSFGSQVENNRYPDLTASFTTAWKWSGNTETVSYSGGSVSVTNGSAVTIDEGSEDANQKAYVAVLRQEVITKLVSDAKLFADARQYGKLEVELEFPAGLKGWVLGNIISCTIPQIRALPFNLRVEDIQYTTTSDTFTLTEDEGTVGQVL